MKKTALVLARDPGTGEMRGCSLRGVPENESSGERAANALNSVHYIYIESQRSSPENSSNRSVFAKCTKSAFFFFYSHHYAPSKQ